MLSCFAILADGGENGDLYDFFRLRGNYREQKPASRSHRRLRAILSFSGFLNKKRIIFRFPLFQCHSLSCLSHLSNLAKYASAQCARPGVESRDGVVDFVVSSTAAFRRGLRGAHSPLSPVTTTPLSQNKFKAHFAMKPRNLHFVQLFSRPAMNLELES